MTPHTISPEPIGQDEAAARLRAVIGRLSRRLRATVAGSGLTPSQISVLFTIVQRGPVGLSELARIEGHQPDDALARSSREPRRAGLIRRASPTPATAARRSCEATAAGHAPARAHPRERSAALGAQLASELDERSGRPCRRRCRCWRRSPSAPAGPARMTRLRGAGQRHVRGARDPQLPPLHRRPGGLARRHLDADGRAVLAGADAHPLAPRRSG